MKIFLLAIFIFAVIVPADYSVTITKENDLYSINYGSFYVELFAAYKYSYSDNVLLRTNGYGGGQICWEKDEYDYNSGQYYSSYSECYSISQSYAEQSCVGCYSKNYSSLQKINSILIPVSLTELGIY